MNDYERVACIIRYLDARRVEQPDLDELAARAGLSRFHFHRLFSRWAGVTPKDFLQCFTARHARERLQCGETVLDVSISEGLSSPGRLHDLCVSLEAATPGEIKAGGDGWTIEIGFVETPFGDAFIGLSPRGICHFAFVDSRDRTAARAPLLRDWPRARWRWNEKAAHQTGAQIFESRGGLSRTPTVRAFVRATPFQLLVWRALLRVPQGVLVSYGHLASVLGRPKAARAVGSAVACNALAYLIPCHRVIRETGVVGDYRWGRERKRVMLGWEHAKSVIA